MKKRLIVIFDPEESYLYHIIDYINCKMNKLFIAKGFSNELEFLEYCKVNKMDILLLSDDWVEVVLNKINVNMATIIYLGNQSIDHEQHPTINKYQAVDIMMKEVLKYSHLEQISEDQKIHLGEKSRVIGIYSPINGCGKTTLALTLSHIYAHNKSTLYLNTEEFSGLNKLFNIEKASDLSDVFYVFKQTPSKLSSKVVSTTQSYYHFDLIPPFSYSYDLRNIEVKEWIEFLNSLINCTNYEVIVLELTNMIKDIFQLIEYCSVLYMPIKTDYLSQLKIKEFEDFIVQNQKGELLSKIIKLELPISHLNFQSTDYLHQIMMGPFTNYVREFSRDDWGINQWKK